MKIKGFFEDVGGASRVTRRRQEVYDKASPNAKPYDPIGSVARKLHPGFIELEVSEIRDASPTAKTIRFKAQALPYFKAGQFMSIVLNIDGSRVSRPYSISSAPYETRGQDPYIEITVRKAKENGFVSDYLYEKVKVGDRFKAEVGLGEFHYEPLHDARHVVALAGGSGITPFLSMAKEIRFGKLDMDLTILYGSVSKDDIILKEELEKCLCDRVKVIHVLSGEDPDWTGEKGFLNKDIISKYSSDDTSYFVCGPQAMYDYVEEQLDLLNIPKRRIRFEVFGQARDITKYPDYPLEKKDEVYDLKVIQGCKETSIKAKASESIAVALERAGLKIHTACRSGACGFCRIKVLKGSYYVCPANDGRRSQDRICNYVHACSTYPTSDMTIKINI